MNESVEVDSGSWPSAGPGPESVVIVSPSSVRLSKGVRRELCPDGWTIYFPAERPSLDARLVNNSLASSIGDSLRSQVRVESVPTQVTSALHDLELATMIESQEAWRQGRDRLQTSCGAMLERWCRRHLPRPGGFQWVGCEALVTRAGQISTVRESGDGRWVGLHVDNWSHPQMHLSRRLGSSLRVGINLSSETRTLYVVPFALHSICDMGDTVSGSVGPTTQSVNHLLERYRDDLPVVAIDVEPDQAYVFDPNDLVHFVHTLGRNDVDVCVMGSFVGSRAAT